MKRPIRLHLSYQSSFESADQILWGDEILADMPSRLGGEDNRINVA